MKNTSSTSSTSSTIPSTPIPNAIITNACLNNHYLLPTYLYSTNNNHPTHNIITNISLISDTISPNASYSAQTTLHIKNALKELGELSLITYKDKFDNINKNTRLRYSISKNKYQKYFTQIPNKSYEIITEYIYTQSLMLQSTINYFDLITLYCYMKMKIDSFDYVYKATYNSNMIMREPIETISKNLNLGKKTITKYLKILADLNLIQINQNNILNHNKENIYTLP